MNMREMKDSGIDYIGYIPKTWSLTKIKFCADIFGRIGFRGYTEQDLVDYEEDGAITLSPSNIHDIITSAYIAMKAIKAVSPEYFHYLLHAYDVMKVFYNMGNGVRQGLNFSEFSRLMVFEPTIEEQNAIVAYLKEKCDEIDLAIAEKKQQIETIEEYKKSLIFEYVTGKKEVVNE